MQETQTLKHQQSNQLYNFDMGLHVLECILTSLIFFFFYQALYLNSSDTFRLINNSSLQCKSDIQIPFFKWYVFFWSLEQGQDWKCESVSHYHREDKKCCVKLKRTLYVHSLNNYLLNSYYVPSTVLSARLQEWTKTLWYRICKWTSLRVPLASWGIAKNVEQYQ